MALVLGMTFAAKVSGLGTVRVRPCGRTSREALGPTPTAGQRHDGIYNVATLTAVCWALCVVPHCRVRGTVGKEKDV